MAVWAAEGQKIEATLQMDTFERYFEGGNDTRPSHMLVEIYISKRIRNRKVSMREKKHRGVVYPAVVWRSWFPIT